MSNRSRSNKKPGLAWLFSLSLFSVPALAGSLPLSEPTRAWLASQPEISLCYPAIDYPPYLVNGGGLARDLIRQLTDSLGSRVTYLSYPTWRATREAYLAGACDLLPIMSPEGVDPLLGVQSRPLFTVRSALLYRAGARRGSAMVPAAWLSPDTMGELLPELALKPAPAGVSPYQLLQEGKAQAYFGDYLSLRDTLRQHPDLDARLRTLDSQGLLMSMRLVMRDEPRLREAIDIAIRYLPPTRVYRLAEEYVPHAAQAINPPEWSDETLSWLARTREIRVAINPGLSPFSSVGSSGEPVGWAVDVLKGLLRPHGIAISWVPVTTREEALGRLEGGQVDLLLGLPETPALADTLRFTRIMVRSHWAIVTPTSVVTELAQLAGKRVWVPESLWDTDLLATLAPAQWQRVATLDEGARRLRLNEGDAMLADLYQLQYPLQLNRLHDLRINDLATERWGLGFAVAAASPHLATFLDQGIMRITPTQQDELRQRWLRLSVTQVEGVSYGLWIGSSLLLLLTGGSISLLIWRSRRRMALEVVRRREVEKGLSEARERAEAAVEAKGRFLASISHEIRTPMNAIIGLLEWLSGTPLSAEQGRALEGVRQASDELLGLLNDILDFSRNESTQLALTPQRVDLALLCEQVAAIHWPKARDKGLALSLRVEPDLPVTLWLDPHRFAQIVHNLLSNAIKFTPSGRVSLTLGVGDGLLHLAVEDEGPGIEEELGARLFQPFEQGEEARRQGLGTGLGLAICRQLVGQMGGVIGVTARQPGSRFWCRLPLQPSPLQLPRKRVVEGVTLVMPPDEAARWDPWLGRLGIARQGEPLGLEHDEFGLPCWCWRGQRLLPGAILTALTTASQGESHEPPATGTGLKVLLVEDHPLNRQVLAMQLGQLGARVVEAADGAEALQHLERGERVDLVLTDLQMPLVDGAELCRRIKGDARWDGIPVYVITADLSVQAAERLTACGCDGHLDKPVRRQELANLMQGCLPTVVDETPSGLLNDELITLYETTSRQDLALLQRQWREGDSKGWASQLHRIKGSAKMVGAAELVRLADYWQQHPQWDGEAALGAALESVVCRLRRGDDNDQHHHR